MAKSTENPKPLLFTHSDLDGVTCALLFHSKFGHSAPTRFLSGRNYESQIIEKLEEVLAGNKQPRAVYITDLGISASAAGVIERYLAMGGQVHFLDHHESSAWLSVYPWAQVDSSRCAARMLYDYLQPGQQWFNLVRLVDDRDRWVRALEGSDDIAAMMGRLGTSAFMHRFEANPDPTLSGTEKDILAMARRQVDRYFQQIKKSLRVVQRPSGGIGAGIADNYISDVGNRLLDEMELSAVALWDPYEQRIFLRSRQEVNVNLVAQAMGDQVGDGGGHSQAAGVKAGKLVRQLSALTEDLYSATIEVIGQVLEHGEEL